MAPKQKGTTTDKGTETGHGQETKEERCWGFVIKGKIAEEMGGGQVMQGIATMVGAADLL